MPIFGNEIRTGAAGASGSNTYELFAWGDSETHGALGDGTTISRSSPVQIGDAFFGELDVDTDGVDKLQCRITAASSCSAAVKADGTLWTWGSGSHGMLGDGTTISRCSPAQVGTLTNWRSVAAQRTDSFTATKTDGTLWGWGQGSGHGGGHAISYSSPVQVGTDTNWSFMLGGGESGAYCLKTDGTLYAWGSWSAGALTGATGPSQTPKLVTDKYWKWVGSGTSNAFAGIEKDTGKLWSWGSNGYGKFDHGNTTDLISPVQVGTDTDWSHACGQTGNSMMFAKTNGELYGCGRNDNGTLGTGNNTSYSSPAQIGSDKSWAAGGHGNAYNYFHAITDANGDNTGGECWYVGGGTGQGGAGTGSNINRSSPVQVGTDTNWICVRKGGQTKSGACLAIKKT